MGNKKIKLRVRWGKHLPGDIIEMTPQIYEVSIRKGYGIPAGEPEPQKIIKVAEPRKKRKKIKQ